MNVCHIQAVIAYKVELRTTLNEKLALMAKRSDGIIFNFKPSFIWCRVPEITLPHKTTLPSVYTLFFIRTSNFAAEAEPKLNVLIVFHVLSLKCS